MALRDEEENTERMAAIRARINKSLADPRPAVSSADVQERLKAHAHRAPNVR
jgi:hypothetical protein